jgi:predicted transcriptional regulator
MYVLLALDKMPMCTKTDIMRLDPGNEKTKFKRINDLIAEGFIECVYSSEYKSKRLNLTAEGKELVIRIKKVRALLLRHRRNRS